MKEAPTQLADGERTALPLIYLHDVNQPPIQPQRCGQRTSGPIGTVLETNRPRARDTRSGRRGSSATNTGSRNACRMQHSYEFENSLQHVLSECQPSSCFFTVSCGSIDFVRLRIRVIGTLNKTGSGSVDCGSPSRGRSSTARFGGVWSDRRVGRWDPKQCLPVIPQVIANPNRRRLPFHAASY
ncbi:BZ3501_MvSof-1269-A2-R1_Chr12-3g03631 [Microbotryum saponariae]|nr:BZ3501_MvSof-1269-A2-R1_Chr12-3g03631 [Microbotryum saponariae]